MSRTYIGIGISLFITILAHAFIKESAHGLSQRFIKAYVKGRGRYGATPHPKLARLEIILQERLNGGFKKREEEDPLEWIRVRLRNAQKNIVPGPEELYNLKIQQRPKKNVYEI